MTLSMCLALVVPAYADTTTPKVSFETKKTIYEPGKDITVTINIDSDTAFDALYIWLHYDHDALTLKEYKNTVSGDLVDYNTETDDITLAWNTAKSITKLCDVVFTVKDTVPGNANYEVTAKTDSSYSINGGGTVTFAASDIEGVTLTPDPANLPSIDFDFEDATVEYDGNTHTLSATYNSNTPSSPDPEYSYKYNKKNFEGASDAGTYVITATAKRESYKDTSKNATLKIEKKGVTVTDINLNSKRGEISGVIEADQDNVALDFSKAHFTFGGALGAGDAALNVEGLALKGTKAGNYYIAETSNVVVEADDVRYARVKAPKNGDVKVNEESISEMTDVYVLVDGVGGLSLEAEADTNYTFGGWYVDGNKVSSKAEYTLTYDDLKNAGTSVAEVEGKFVKKTSNKDNNGGGNSSGNSYYDYVVGGSNQIAGGSTIGSNQGTTTTSKTDFKDLVGDYAWAADAVNALAAAGIINGRTENTFDPASYVTRAEFAKMICVAMAIPEAANTTIPTFTDVTEDDWYFGWVEAAAAKGIVNGVTETTFAPNDLVTREQMASMLYRAIVSMNYAQLLPGGTAVSFADYDAISDYAKTAVVELSKSGVINGVTDTMFAPQAPATRAQAAVMIYQYFSAINAI